MILCNRINLKQSRGTIAWHNINRDYSEKRVGSLE